jgi:tetratricopeptide (TPR) repeat protein
MNREKTFLILLILVIASSMMYGQRIFRPIDPNNGGARYGKSPYSGPPFLYFGSTSYQYRIAHSQYNIFLSDVDAAFASWNNSGPVQFSRTTSGLTLTAQAQDYNSWGPAWCYPSWNGSTYELTPASGSIVLNTNATWRNDQQRLNANPPILDVQTMVVHEAGHIHGLAHPLTNSYAHDATAPTMAGGDNAYFNNTLDVRSLETEDIYGTQFLQLRVPTLYSSLETAINKAAEIGIGYVYIMSNYTLSGNISVSAQVNLVIRSGTTINLNNYSIISSNGTITVESGAVINGFRAIVKSGSDIKGIYPTSYTVQQLIDLCLSGWSINLVPGTYTENLNMKAGVTVTGSGPSATIINGTVTFDNDANASLTGSTVNGKITILSNSSGVTLSDINAGSSSCYLDVTGQSAYVINFNSNYSQSYNVWVNNASLFNMALGSLTNKGTALTVDYYTAGYTNSVIFCQNTYDISAGFSTGSVSAMECSFSSSTVGGSVYGNVTWDIWNYCGGGSHSLMSSVVPGNNQSASDYDGIFKNYIKLMKSISTEQKNSEDKNPKKYLNTLLPIAEQFKNIIRTNPESSYSAQAVGNIASIYRFLEEYNQLENFTNELLKTKLLRFHALKVQIPSNINQTKYKKAIDIADQIIKEYPTDSSINEIMYNKGLVYKYYLNDEKKANETFNEVIAKDPKHAAAVFAMAELGIGENFQKEITKTAYGSLSSEADEIEINNYPNPFNPATTINYSLTQAGHVVLKVYDILGREIAELVNGVKEKGKHSVVFNASKYASGFYVYTIRVNDFYASKKMLLAK